MTGWRGVSLWMDQLEEPLTARPALSGRLQADVAIIGAGYTGLWTAYYLKRLAPHLKVVILEAQTAGFGASGRNGGWLMGNLLGEDRLLGGLPASARAEGFGLLQGIPDEVAAVCQREKIDCDLRKGGVLYCAARYPEQESRLRGYLESYRALGLGEADYRWLEPSELSARLNVANAYGALYSPHCATVQPAKLARGLARAVERLGVTLFERSPVVAWGPGSVTTATGEVRADWVVPAVEGYSSELSPLGKHQLAAQSLIVATEPLSEDTWAGIGLAHGQAFSESSRQVTYGQRSADNRLIFGARGGYRFGGRLRQDFNLTCQERALRQQLFSELFPTLRNVRLTHAWGGNLGVARRFHPHMLADRRQQVALSGGYGGEGVGASNLGGRTLADLILGRETALTRQPWVVGDRPLSSLPRWEPEPFRWLGYNAIIRSFVLEDRVLRNPVTSPWRRRMAEGLAGAMERLMHSKEPFS
ncbi:NAD(P)/FAD-dependent oxidoreductase [Pseudomonas sp. DC3200b2]|uniref:NAD(P)/FAD-dependent oxidoreductase n=1 Tax=Pseudomonas sp. DC3200b2 TaxID=2804669 RepID=UPI003CE83DCF